MLKRLLVTGASGFLGWNFCRAAAGAYETIGIYGRHPVKIAGVATRGCDLTDYSALKRLMNDLKPDAVVHTAALSRPNQCQTHPEASYRINVEASQNMAGLCAEAGIACVFTSSDLVFNGRRAPYAETDPVSPICTYGAHKVAAENGMRARHPQTTICRMALMFGPSPATAAGTLQPMLAALRRGEKVQLFTDEFRTPMGAATAVNGLLLALSHPGTTLHIAGEARISRYELGRKVAEVFNLPQTGLTPCRSADLPMPAPRSDDVSLDIRKAKALGFKPLSIEAELRAFFMGPCK